MGLQDRDYVRDRRLNFPDLHPRPWWKKLGIKWRTWLWIAISVVTLAGGVIWLVRDTRSLFGGFDSGPDRGSLVVNINTATETELQKVPGIGPARAAEIVARRPWKSVDDLIRIQGIGSDQLEGMRPFLTTTGETEKRRD